MASFLQNNGDIILDAVLTDYGRRLLAKGDGSFNIVKFAFGDDEIDYGLFNPDTSSIFQDIEIMNTPILEAFTNNAASMKSTLMTLGMENILFLPVMKLNSLGENKTGQFLDGVKTVFDGYVVPVDVSTTNMSLFTSYALTSSVNKDYREGVLNVGNRNITIDQGLDSDKLNSLQNLKDVSPMLYETEYHIHVDNRFCSIGKNASGILSAVQPLSIDDDNIAIYRLSEGSTMNNNSFVMPIRTDATNLDSTIVGTKGSRLSFTIVPNGNLLYTNTMFEKYGKVLKLNPAQPTKEFMTIRMPVRITGANTGYSIEIPVLFAKIIN